MFIVNSVAVARPGLGFESQKVLTEGLKLQTICVEQLTQGDGQILLLRETLAQCPSVVFCLERAQQVFDKVCKSDKTCTSVCACVCVSPDQRVAACALGTVIQHVLQRQGEGQALSVRDVEVCDVVEVVHTHKHLLLRRICYVVLL